MLSPQTQQSGFSTSLKDSTVDSFDQWLSRAKRLQPLARVTEIESFGDLNWRDLDYGQLAEIRALYAGAEDELTACDDANDPGIPKY